MDKQKTIYIHIHIIYTYTEWTKSPFTFELVAASSSNDEVGVMKCNVANGNLVPWHHSVRDNLHSAYVSTISITKILHSLQHTA